MVVGIPWKRDRRRRLPGGAIARGISGGFTVSRRQIIRCLITGLAFFAILPPIFFHFKLKRFQQMQWRRCSWLKSPPLVCAHGGDSSKAFPNTMDAYRVALHSEVDCIEIDVSRTFDGELFALHDRDLQRILGNSTSKVGHLSKKEIEKLNANHHHTSKFHDVSIPSLEDALKLVSGSVHQVILDAKVGPPLFEKSLSKDIITAVEKIKCNNCLVWAKSDSLIRDIMKQSADIAIGYIVMMDPTTGTRTNLLRMRGAQVVGVYYPLIDENLVKIVHRRKKKVYAWTVDEEIAMQKMLFEQVDAVVTSNPTLFQRVMQSIRTECLEGGFSLSS